jgi:protein-disulfide isomerase
VARAPDQPLIAALLGHALISTEDLANFEEAKRVLRLAVARDNDNPFAGAWAGAPDGDVVLVEFFDYACGYCRKSNADVERLLREDPKLKVVWREWPVLGPDSETAARASLAAARAGRFKPFHDALFAAGRPSAETVAKARAEIGLEGDLAAAEADRELARNFQLARNLEASGTPTFVVGDQIFQGAVGYEALRDAIRETRTKS